MGARAGDLQLHEIDPRQIRIFYSRTSTGERSPLGFYQTANDQQVS